MAKKLKTGNARIVSIAKQNDQLFYVIEDLEDQKTNHIAVWKKPTWSKKLSSPV